MRKRHRCTLQTWLLIVLLLPVSGFATPSTPQQTGDAYELWRARSELLTDDLLKDAGQLTAARRAVIMGRLAQGWWDHDQTRARKWFQNAIELVEQVPSKETSIERRERIISARKILKMVAPLDQTLTLPLIKILTPNGQTSDSERSENAESLMNSATDLVAVDPNRANELAGLALRIGPPDDVASFLVAMRGKDPQRADAMFTHALSLAKQQSFPVQLLNSLTYAAFPKERNYARNAPFPSDNLRSELLEYEINFLNAYPIDDDNRGSICSCVSGFIGPMLSEFDRLLPTDAIVVRQAIDKCQPATPPEQPHTAEDFLKASADAKDGRARANYEFRAAYTAYGARDYELAIKILDGMGKEQREFMGKQWESFRWSWAAQRAVDYYRSGRLAEMNVILNTVPANLQPFAKIAFLDSLFEPKDADPAPLIQILNEALIDLRSSNATDLEKYNWYIALVRPTVKYQPVEANGVLKAAVSFFNKAKDRETLDSAEFSKLIAEPLLAMDEFVVKESIASITLAETRANLRLVLLTATLHRMNPQTQVGLIQSP
jgi:hypothetical protein